MWILGLKGLMILLVDDLLDPCPSGKYMYSFNSLKPTIKIQILICYPYTFSIEVVGRIC